MKRVFSALLALFLAIGASAHAGSLSTDRVEGITASVAVKAPVRIATTANITLSGLQTVDGTVLVAEDRVLVKNQTTATQNGLWTVKSTAWQRTADFDGNRDVVKGTLVMVTDGTTNANTYWRVSTSNPIVIGTSSISFERASVNDAATMSWLQSGTGAATRGVQDTFRGERVSADDFCATVDGTTDNSTCLTNAVSATPAGGLLTFERGKTYILNAQIYLTQSIHIDCRGATIKLPDSASLFTTAFASYQPYLLHIRSSDISIQNCFFDGNSRNNVLAGGFRYDNTHGIGMVMLGFYNTAASAELRNILFTGNVFYDGVKECLDSLMQGNAYASSNNKYINGLRIVGNHFERCQGVQLSLSDTVGAVVTGNTHRDPYFAAFQPYYRNVALSYVGNTIDLSSARVDKTLVNPTLKSAGSVTSITRAGATATVTTSASHGRSSGDKVVIAGADQADYNGTFSITVTGPTTFTYTVGGAPASPATGTITYTWTLLVYGYVQLGKTATDPSIGVNFSGNTLYGAHIYFTEGMEYSTVSGNLVYLSEKIGIAVAGIASGGIGNAITNNLIIGANSAGLYLDVSANPILVEGNNLNGNNTKAHSTGYGGNDLESQIVVFDADYILSRNLVRKNGTTPAFGVTYATLAIYNAVTAKDNDVAGGGNTADAIINTDLTYPPVTYRSAMDVNNQGILQHDVTIPSADQSTLNSVPYEIVAAPPTGKAIIYEDARVYRPAQSAGSGVAANEDYVFRYTNGSGTILSATCETTGFIDQTTAQYRYVPPIPSAAEITPVINTALVLHQLNGDSTAGDGNLKVRIRYRFETLGF